MTIASRIASGSLPSRGTAAWIADGLAALAVLLRSRVRAAQAGNELRALSDEQLADIGVERSACEASRPAVEVDGAVMRRLMSMS